MKKLIVVVSKKQWLSDSTQLTAFSTAALVEDLHYFAPSLEQLQRSLEGIVRTLSKPAEYSAIAGELITKLHPLYTQATAQETVFFDRALPTANVPAASSPPASEPTRQPEATHPSTPASSVISSGNLFDVRLGILKYANPLKAKILAFSALYSDFQFNPQEWLALKQHELDGLLQTLLITCKSYTDLELRLYNTARRLTVPDDLVATADTMTKCLRSFYIHGSPTLTADSLPEMTRMSLDEFEESTQGLTMIDEDGTISFPTTTALTLEPEHEQRSEP
jgi:hypothetical protein